MVGYCRFPRRDIMEPIRDASSFQRLCGKLSNNDSEIDIVSLTTFGDADGFCITDTDAKDLACCLELNTHVTELYLNITKLSVRGGIALMQYIIMSGKTLSILGLQGRTVDQEPEEMDAQIIVVDVLVRAAIQNTSNLALEFENCPIARSSLLCMMLQSSLLSEISISGGRCRLIIDNEDPILEEQSFSSHLQVLGINCCTDGDELSVFLLNCSPLLPSLKKLFLSGRTSIPKSLVKSHSLEHLSYVCSQGLLVSAFDPRPYDSIIDFIENTDRLKQIFLNLQKITADQRTNIFRAFKRNRSLTSVWQDPIISRGLHAYCKRNQMFLKEWQDLKQSIPANLFAHAAAVAVQSNDGRTACFQRLPLVLMDLLR